MKKIIDRSEIRRPVASVLEILNSCRTGCLEKDVEKCRVESSAEEWIEHSFRLRRSLMNDIKSVCDTTEPCGTPLFTGKRRVALNGQKFPPRKAHAVSCSLNIGIVPNLCFINYFLT